jgi:hypothetical protein
MDLKIHRLIYPWTDGFKIPRFDLSLAGWIQNSTVRFILGWMDLKFHGSIYSWVDDFPWSKKYFKKL